MSKPPVFLDRDGTLIVEKEYLSDPEQVSLEATVIEGLTMLGAHHHPLIVVTNQSGIGRGIFSDEDARRVNAKVDSLLRGQGINILAWYVCPHAPGVDCDCRKPLPGMALTAAREWSLQLQGSFVVGDKRADVELADAIGGTGILLTSGHGREHLQWATDNARPVFGQFRDAALFIVNQRNAP
jgi:D-glycero-D-manno-heptose 1,7-bisphosphate phosphatase